MVAPTQLLGLWRLQRRLIDRAAGRSGRVDGMLELAMDGAEVRWSERGWLTWGDERFRVTRELRICRGDDEHGMDAGTPVVPGWTVCFEDGRPFHPWVPGEPVEHVCGEDTYRGLVDVDATWTTLRVLWDVTGPAKAQRLFSRCTRVLTPVEAAAIAARRRTRSAE